MDAKGIKMGGFQITRNGKVVFQEEAKNIFDFQIEKAKVLICNCKNGDFLFESTLVQQVVVLLVTALERYARFRFCEISKEGKVVNLGALCEAFIPKKYRDLQKKEIEETAKSENKPEIEILVGKRIINFQNWDDLRKAYKKGYGITFGEAAEANFTKKLKKYIQWRHDIVHATSEKTLLDYDEKGSPIFSNKLLAENATDVFVEFVGSFHNLTKT